jgi:glycosyltransferase involved in cell wall biosynthesis
MSRSRVKGYVARAMRGLASKTSAFICISDYVRNLVKGYGVPEEKLVRIYCGTETKVRKEFPSSLREELGIDLDVPVIGTTGIWRPNKGFPHFIAAGEIINKRLPHARFLLGGKAYGPDSAYATTIWMRGRILRSLNALEYTGYMDDVGKFMSALDIFVLPSDCEPFGLVMIEAMARGVPVVATNAGGAPEIVTHGETGLLVPPQNAQAMAEAIYYLICHPLERMQMGETAKIRVQRLFDYTKMVREYEALYLRTLQPKKIPASGIIP